MVNLQLFTDSNLKNKKLSLTFQSIDTFLPFEQKPFLVAGPCSAETEEQVLAIAAKLQPIKPHLFRAGIWKPRTRPGAFEGIGKVGLQWLQKVKTQFGYKTTVEVASAQHVEECLKHDIDVLWIGARSTVNPFTVQEIADALRGKDIPVMIKNPVNPDLNLWVGAIERIYNSGVKKIIAIHRGFSSFDKSKYRNEPMWEIPIELKRIFPDLFIICDPSHITGKRENIPAVAQKAMDLNFDGLMVETHFDPDNAWSDQAQQVTPVQLGEILAQLIIRNISSDDAIFNNSLEELRGIIDRVDRDLVNILRERMNISEQIGLLKKENNITILQPERWSEIFNSRQELAQQLQLNPEIIYQIFQLIHAESIRRQTEVMNKAIIKV
jgi:chorismate mutase